MKIIMQISKVIIIFIEFLLLFVCASELYDFLKSSDTYHIGSEAMVENGGWQYRSVFSYIFFNSLMIILSILLSFLTLRSRKIKILLLILLFVIFQIGCFIML